ncbi:TIR domain-containing protein [Sphingomonas sp. AOB5]|uniref:TIR domain-containing protein n=1 Tax=Sphingomonas sp. AOB5 TaxID=3034017 RepID=UPI0023F9C5F5|nr:TIR domain-containing protein [Sphingomonas sp. AOB5]MDF7775109.1 TIR domain-containing protein [Sphingomonas sp. AOB5]
MQGFVSYSHDDQKACGELRKHLRPLGDAFGIQFHSDHGNRIGQDFDAKIRKMIADAQLHVILFSTNLLWSDYIMETELPLIHGKKRDKGDLVLGIVLDHCAWELVAGSWVVAPLDDDLRLRPIKGWRDRNLGFSTARKQLQKSIEDHFGVQPKLIGGAA